MEKISDLNGKREQSVAIKFCVRLGKSPTETVEMIHTAYQEAALPQNKIFEWHKRFSGLTVVDDQVKTEGSPDDDPEEGASPFNANVCEESHQARSIKAMIKKDRRVTEEQVAEAMQLELARVHVIIHEILGYKKIGERWKKKKAKFRNDL